MNFFSNFWNLRPIQKNYMRNANGYLCREFVGKNFKNIPENFETPCHCASVMDTENFDMYEAGTSFSSLLLNEWIEFTFYILYLFYLYVISNKITIKIVNPIYDPKDIKLTWNGPWAFYGFFRIMLRLQILYSLLCGNIQSVNDIGKIHEIKIREILKFNWIINTNLCPLLIDLLRLTPFPFRFR